MSTQEYHKEYYINNKEKFNKNWKEVTAKYRARNPEKIKLSLEKSRKNFPERNLLNKAKSRAKKKNIEFSLAIEDIYIPEYCPLLHTKLDAWGPLDACPSLDRVDNTKGYTKDNIWVISFKANRMKNTATNAELKLFAQNILSIL